MKIEEICWLPVVHTVIIFRHSLFLSSCRVLRALLGELIRRTVTQSYPKLLLRRTESVAERMLTNWLTFCLHGYIMVRQRECGGRRGESTLLLPLSEISPTLASPLSTIPSHQVPTPSPAPSPSFLISQEHMGQPLYLLFRAVKNQLEKGPIDVITEEARYSLSEQKLICQKMDVEVIDVGVDLEDGLRVPLKMLDCDTISQAKEKLLDAMYRVRRGEGGGKER